MAPRTFFDFRRSAFSMIEMLVTISIIGLLSAMLFPALAKLKRTADRTSSIAGLKTMSSGIFSFASDNNGKLPGPLYGGQNPGYSTDPARLPWRIWPYTGDPQPTSKIQYAKFMMPVAYKRIYKDIDPSSLGTTYLVLNGNPADQYGAKVTSVFGSTSGSVEPRNLSSVPSPSKNWMAVEVDQQLWDVGQPVMGAKPSWLPTVSPTPLGETARAVVYFDGRVAMSPSGTFPPQ